MAGRTRPSLTAGRRALKLSSDRLLKAAVALDRIDTAAGERLRMSGAAALDAAVATAIGTSEPEPGRRTDARTY